MLSDLTSAFPTKIVVSRPSALEPDILSALKVKVSAETDEMPHDKKKRIAVDMRRRYFILLNLVFFGLFIIENVSAAYAA